STLSALQNSDRPVSGKIDLVDPGALGIEPNNQRPGSARGRFEERREVRRPPHMDEVPERDTHLHRLPDRPARDEKEPVAFRPEITKTRWILWEAIVRTTSSSVASGKTVKRPEVISSPTVVFSNPARTRAGRSGTGSRLSSVRWEDACCIRRRWTARAMSLIV